MKERIIGAAVLVLVVVLVVPVFLDGPEGDGEMRTERVPLPGQADQDTKTVVLDRDRTEPVPSNGAAQQPTPKPQPAASKPQARPAAAEPKPGSEPVAPEDEDSANAPAPVASATGMWAVQLGSFSNQENAERLAAELRKQGHAAFLSQVATAEGQRHRVRIGPQESREAADTIAARLTSEGHDVKVLPHP
ncbi:MAG: hypothetical protein GTO71_13475 [Woeseiaceae bacterium]|nr:hypothetical protein [Woeseiaceae bacterium]NIP22074.1 hypothetical protein [Woeseiaceae bacterium]NIS91188.1 hypothetical protein [Woeseiaceae bacterium]